MFVHQQFIMKWEIKSDIVRMFVFRLFPTWEWYNWNKHTFSATKKKKMCVCVCVFTVPLDQALIDIEMGTEKSAPSIHFSLFQCPALFNRIKLNNNSTSTWFLLPHETQYCLYFCSTVSNTGLNQNTNRTNCFACLILSLCSSPFDPIRWLFHQFSNWASFCRFAFFFLCFYSNSFFENELFI